MVRKLQRDGLRADLETVETLLRARTADEDPTGWMQFSARKEELEQELKLLDGVPESTASVGLFFSGQPVLGSRGVFADFGGRALDEFQTLVSTQLAASEGPVGSRGPIPQKQRAQLIVTDVSRGSFGFLLEEATSEGQLLVTPTRMAVEGVADLLFRISSPDEESFAVAADLIDPRVLASVKSFVKLVDDSGASLRVVEGDRDFSLRRDAVQRARQRTEFLSIDEDTAVVDGILYLLPDAKRFELHGSDGARYRGTIAPDALAALIDERGEARANVIGEAWRVLLNVRRISAPNREARLSYKLGRVFAKSQQSLGGA